MNTRLKAIIKRAASHNWERQELARQLLLDLARNSRYFEIPVTAATSVNLSNGSGEIAQAARVARYLRDKGYNAVLFNTSDPNEALTSLGSVYTAHPELISVERELYSSTVGTSRLSREAMERLLQNIPSAAERAEFVKLLESGKLDGLNFGTLRDSLKVTGAKDLISGAIRLGTREGLNGMLGTSPGFITTERGMNYSTMPGGFTGADIVQRRFPYENVYSDKGPKNIGFDAAYRANLDPDRIPALPSGAGRINPDALVPFSGGSAVYADPGTEEHAYRTARKAINKFISGGYDVPLYGTVGKGGLPADRRIIYLTSGSTGQGMADKLRLAYDAVGSDPNVHFLVQGGADALKGGLKYNKGLVDLANELTAGSGLSNITMFNAVPSDLHQKFMRGSDAIAGYGGSSTAAEMAATRTPGIIYSDSKLNFQNARSLGENVKYPFANGYVISGGRGWDVTPEARLSEIDKYKQFFRDVVRDPVGARATATERAELYREAQRMRDRRMLDIVSSQFDFSPSNAPEEILGKTPRSMKALDPSGLNLSSSRKGRYELDENGALKAVDKYIDLRKRYRTQISRKRVNELLGTRAPVTAAAPKHVTTPVVPDVTKAAIPPAGILKTLKAMASANRLSSLLRRIHI